MAKLAHAQMIEGTVLVEFRAEVEQVCPAGLQVDLAPVAATALDDLEQHLPFGREQFHFTRHRQIAHPMLAEGVRRQIGRFRVDATQ